MDLRNKLEPILALVNHSWMSLVDLDLSWCNLDFSNIKNLFDALKKNTLKEADEFHQGVIKGILRALNLSYNPCLAPKDFNKRSYDIINRRNII